MTSTIHAAGTYPAGVTVPETCREAITHNNAVRVARALALKAEQRHFDGHPWTRVSPLWWETRDCDPVGYAHYRAHYTCPSNRGHYANYAFAGTGEKMVLIRPDALFVWRSERFRKDKQPGINCAIFRNTGPVLSSYLPNFCAMPAASRGYDGPVSAFLPSLTPRALPVPTPATATFAQAGASAASAKADY